MNKVVKKCIDTLGSMEKVAEAAGVSTSMVWKWLHGKSPVTATSVLPLEAEMGGIVNRTHLRPDLYPKEHPPK